MERMERRVEETEERSVMDDTEQQDQKGVNREGGR